METDHFFYQLLQQLPETLFALVDQPIARAADYRFEATELKKSYRLDGLFIPKRGKLPLYFVEVQFRRKRTFYANLFAKVFSYLEKHDPEQDWMAVAIFPNRSAEPRKLRPYEVLLASRHVRRIFLDELSIPAGAPPGLAILQLVTAEKGETPALVSQILERTRSGPDCEREEIIVELLEEVLIRRFNTLDREEIRRMFKLHDIRKTRVWQEAHEEGRDLERQKVIARMRAKGQTLKEIAEFLEISLAEVRRLTNKTSSQ